MTGEKGEGSHMVLLDKIKGLSLKTKIIIGSVFVVLVVAIVIAVVLLNRSAITANTMRLLRCEGTVSIEDSKGQEKPVLDNIRFQSGDALNTGFDGIASVGLDDTKIVTLQNDSRAEFLKSGKKLELKLTKGGLYFEVTEKLNDDESFEIKTSTMTVGIRGTSGYVFCDEDGRPAVIITDGKVHIVAKNPDTGEVKETDCEAGHKVKVYTYSDRTENTVTFEEEEVEVDDLNSFMLSILADDEELLEKVCADTGWSKEEILALAANPYKDIDPTEPEGSSSEESSEPSKEDPPSSDSSEEDPSDPSDPEDPEDPTPTPKPKKTPTPAPTLSPTPSPEPTPDPTPDPTKASSSEPTQTDPPPADTSEPKTEESKEEPKTEDEGPEIPENSDSDHYSKEVWDPNGDGSVYVLVHQMTGDVGDMEYEYLGYINGDWIHLDREPNDDGGYDLFYLDENEEPVLYYTIS